VTCSFSFLIVTVIASYIMGKPSSPTPPTPDADAISLRTQPDGYFEDDGPSLDIDNDDLPPLYSDHDETSGSGAGQDSASAPLLAQGSSEVTEPQYREPLRVTHFDEPFSRDNDTGAEYYLEPRLSQDPKALEEFIRRKARQPPRQLVRIYGWHHERTSEQTKQGNKTSERRVTDFDLFVDLTPYFYIDAAQRKSWQEFRVAHHSEMARRGTVFRQQDRAWDVEAPEGPHGDRGQRLGEYCHRFCAGSGGLRCFRLKRYVIGLDTATLHAKLMQLKLSTNYRGHMEVTFPLKNATIDVYNPSKINQWRLTSWIRWIFYLTFLWIFTWPFLFFATKRWEVVFAVWPFSQPGTDGRLEYATISEEQWYNMWGRLIYTSILQKRQATLDPQEIDTSDQARPPSFNSGNAGVDSALGFVAASVEALGEINRASGWGYDV
jgi:hypothetical protein